MVQHNFQQVSTLFTDTSRSNNTSTVNVPSYPMNTNQLDFTNTNNNNTSKQGYLNTNLQNQRNTAQSFNYYDQNFQYPNFSQNSSIVQQQVPNAQNSTLPSYTNLTSVANTLVKNPQFLRNFPNVYENLNNSYNTSNKNCKYQNPLRTKIFISKSKGFSRELNIIFLKIINFFKSTLNYLKYRFFQLSRANFAK